MAKRVTDLTIVSVYPEERRAERHYGPEKTSGYSTFVLPAAPLGEFTTLTIEDCYEQVYYGETVGKKPRIVEAMEIAQDLVAHWRDIVIGTDSGYGPGIFIAKGDVPTEEELENARASQEAYFEYLIQQAEQKHRDNKGDEITDTHRAAAKWMGREGYEWTKRISQIVTKECPLCTVQIPAKAVICPNCHHQIAALPANIAAFSNPAPVAAPEPPPPTPAPAAKPAPATTKA
jgi:hypothetical protein